MAHDSSIPNGFNAENGGGLADHHQQQGSRAGQADETISAEGVRTPSDPGAGTGEGNVTATGPTTVKKDGVSRIGNFEIHPVAEVFPVITGKEFADLCASVKAFGVINPIKTLGGQVIDGRNRLRAAVTVGMTDIVTEELPAGTDPVTYALAQNVSRRHLTPRQRAAITVKLADTTGQLARLEEAAQQAKVAHLRQGDAAPSPSSDGNGAGRVSEKLAEMADVSRATVDWLLKRRKAAPEKFEEEVQAAMTGTKLPKEVKASGEKDSAANQADSSKATIEVPVGDAVAAARLLAKHYQLGDSHEGVAQEPSSRYPSPPHQEGQGSQSGIYSQQEG